MPGHDIIVVGASAGGVEALRTLVGSLPVDLPAAVFIVLHIPADSPSALPSILRRSGQVHVMDTKNGIAIAHGHIYVAPPNLHLLVEQGYVRLTRGPKENRSRPAVDPLFRSAARSYGPRVVGVVLSGNLDDGTSGLSAIKRRGGKAIVQDPEDALYPGMPQSAIANVDIDYVLPLADISAMLVRLAHEQAADENQYPLPQDLEIEAHIPAMEGNTLENVEKLGEPSIFTCPECHGMLWELYDGDVLRFRCHVGHAYTTDSMVADQSESVERALWAALRSLEEQSALTRRLARRAREQNQLRAAGRFEKAVHETEQHIEVMRKILENGNKHVWEEERGA